MTDDPSTQDPAPAGSRRAATAGRVAPALVIAWVDGAPELDGALLLPDDTPQVFGRGGGDPGEARLSPIRQVPGQNLALGALDPVRLPWLSRRQLRIQRLGPRLLFENLGRSALRLIPRGVRSDAAPLPTSGFVASVGDLVVVGDRLVFLVVERPHVLPPAPSWTLPLDALGHPDAFGLVGESQAAWTLREEIAFAARQRGHVLVHGPSGSGKERVAAAIHRLSARGNRAWVARNAATIPTTLMDVELFGHVANYPNPGMRERPGLVGEADASSLFLDEIGELSQDLQAHLLRLMDSGDYQRLGDSRPRRSDVRVIAATNRPLTALKSDLRARFRHVVEVPALDVRTEDIPLIARHLLRQAAHEDPALSRFFTARDLTEPGAATRLSVPEPRLDLDLVLDLLTRPLPLQVRELDALLWRALGESARRGVDHIQRPATPATPADAAAPEPLEVPETAPREVTRATLEAALVRCNGHLERVWRELGLKNRYVLRRLLQKHQLRAGSADPEAPPEPPDPEVVPDDPT
ncbi:MAG: sigma-54-dependent Fis family transcriptional regulator [Deltaproteobacteria bacterium]|nr:sigma-54-dependent Fis family transcriptional regulator [Deltaproteobacteria bacterium]